MTYTVIRVERGAEAERLIKSYHEWNVGVADCCEYVLVWVEAELCGAPDESRLVQYYDWYLTSDRNQLSRHLYTIPDSELFFRVHGGESRVGQLVFIVDAQEQDLTLVYGPHIICLPDFTFIHGSGEGPRYMALH